MKKNSKLVLVTSLLLTSTFAISKAKLNSINSHSISNKNVKIVADDDDDTCTAGTNLTLNGEIADFSTEQNTTNTVTNLLNEDPNNRWSAENYPQYAVIDLGELQDIDRIGLSLFAGRDYGFTIEGSATSATSGFSTLVDGSDNESASTLISESFDTVNVRYVKLTITAAKTYDGPWVSVNYLAINCAGGEFDPTIEPMVEEALEQPETIIILEDLDPNLAPSENFDLSEWNLSVPIDRGDGISTNVTIEDLNEEYQLTDVEGKDYFYTAADGGMVFRNYPKDAPKTSQNTSYSRTELRELISGVDEGEGVQDPDNNWYFSSSDDIPDDAGGIDGVLTATLSVDQVTTGGDDNHVGRVIIGQIHASDNEPNRLYYHKLPEHEKGAIYVAHENHAGGEAFFNIIGNHIVHGSQSPAFNSSIEDPVDGIALGEKFSYKIEVKGNDQWVTITREGKNDLVLYIDMAESDYENDWMYFKAGVYSQNNTTDNDEDYDQATFYALSQTHNSDDVLSVSENILDSLNDNVTVYPNPFIDTVKIDFSGNTLSSAVKIRIVDTLGKVISSTERNLDENSIELHTNFNSGFYFIQLLDVNDTIIAVKKVINK